MLDQLKGKFPLARVAQSDAEHIPFETGQFDAVLTVHVMHFISGWKTALQEYRRVLRPEGIFINARTYEATETSLRRLARDHWSRWVAERGFVHLWPGVRENDEFVEELRRMGAEVTEWDVTRYTHSYTLRGELDRIRSRIYSDTWDLPDEVFAASLEHLEPWMEDQFGDLDQSIEEEVTFKLETARFGRLAR
jgi:SAM-dependent methyltransferase